jgi:hypothetical protein
VLSELVPKAPTVQRAEGAGGARGPIRRPADVAARRGRVGARALGRLRAATAHDECGATAGILTLEDVPEEIAGDLAEESDRSGAPVERHDTTSASAAASLSFDGVDAALRARLPRLDGHRITRLRVTSPRATGQP